MNILTIFVVIIAIITTGIGLYYFIRYLIENGHKPQLFSTISSIIGGKEKRNKTPILNVFLDERNFYFATHTGNVYNKTLQPTFTLDQLKKYLKEKYPQKVIKMHIITKNSNTVNYTDEFDSYDDRYNSDTDILYIANTTYDTEKISKTSNTHHLRGRDDFLALLLALEYLDKGEEILIISNDKFKDMPFMYEMPAFNMIRIDGENIEKRHINPSKYKYMQNRFKKIIDNPKLKIEIPGV
jgi:hypothetical protein